MRRIVVASILLFASAAPAQGPEALRGEVRAHLRELRLAKLTQALMLDAPTSQRLAAVLAQKDEQLEPLRRARREHVARLRAELDSGRPDTAKLLQEVDQLEALRRQRSAVEEARIQAVRQVLTPVQQAKLVLSWRRINQELHAELQRSLQQGLDEE